MKITGEKRKKKVVHKAYKTAVSCWPPDYYRKLHNAIFGIPSSYH